MAVVVRGGAPAVVVRCDAPAVIVRGAVHFPGTCLSNVRHGHHTWCP